MTLQEINKEIRIINEKEGKLLNHADLERLRFLISEKERLITIDYHYNQDISIAEIQLAAKVIFAQLNDTPYRNNLENINCPAPDELNREWVKFRDYEKPIKNAHQFLIDTPNHGKCRYFLHGMPQILGLESNLFLDTAQNTIAKILRNDAEYNISDADNLMYAFIMINSSITNFFLQSAQELDMFSWDAKYSPCFFDRQRILNFRGCMMLEGFKEYNHKKLSICRRYIMRDFAMQIKFLTFWVGLMDTFTFPNIGKSYKSVYGNLIAFLLKNYSNIYIYDIITESNNVSDSKHSSVRGSASNTTRLKIFFTTNDDMPRLIRLDLPHEGQPYVHLNIHTYRSEENLHIPISQEETYSGEYDDVFEPLIDVLRVYNYFTITTRHSPVADDRIMFREMEYWSAMYNLNISAMGEVILGEEDKMEQFPVLQEARNKLIALLEEDGIQVQETTQLSDYDLFELSDNILRGNSIIP